MNGYAIHNIYTDTKNILETYLNYDKVFAGIHDVKLIAGYSWKEEK
jgi:hypothetical protein